MLEVRNSILADIWDSGVTLGAFGGVAGFVALYILSDVPRVRKDILSVYHAICHVERLVLTRLQKVPIIGEHFIKEVPPSDNVCVKFPEQPQNLNPVEPVWSDRGDWISMILRP